MSVCRSALAAPQLTWQMYLMRGFAQLHNLNMPPAARSARAVADSEASLRLQKSPSGYLLLTRAYLASGQSFARPAEVAALKYLDSVAGAPDALHLVAFAALLAGDHQTARLALARFVDSEVKNGHVESGTISGARIGTAEMRGYLPKSLNGLDEKLLSALIDFGHGDYAAAEAFATNSAAGERGQTARTLALSAQILQRHQSQARILADHELKQPGPPAPMLLLFDDLCFVSDSRDEGLKRLQAIALLPLADGEAINLARATVLDQMGQTEPALKIIAAINPAERNDKAPLGMRYTFLDRDPGLELVRLQSKLNQSDKALKLLQKCISNNSQAGQPYFLRAQIYAQKSLWMEARADLSKAAENGFSLVKACRARAGCANALGDKSAAQADMALAAAFIGQN
jgi:tetratricopeptide (TPR) repeat protein